jgi:hypothetical protein
MPVAVTRGEVEESKQQGRVEEPSEQTFVAAGEVAWMTAEVAIFTPKERQLTPSRYLNCSALSSVRLP